VAARELRDRVAVIALAVDLGAASVVLEFSNVNRIELRLRTCEAIATHIF
jgi:hypothetical protein